MGEMCLGTPKFQGKKPRSRGKFLTKKAPCRETRMGGFQEGGSQIVERAVFSSRGDGCWLPIFSHFGIFGRFPYAMPARRDPKQPKGALNQGTPRLRNEIQRKIKIGKRGFRGQKKKLPFPSALEKGALSQKIPMSIQCSTRKMGIF